MRVIATSSVRVYQQETTTRIAPRGTANSPPCLAGPSVAPCCALSRQPLRRLRQAFDRARVGAGSVRTAREMWGTNGQKPHYLNSYPKVLEGILFDKASRRTPAGVAIARAIAPSATQPCCRRRQVGTTRVALGHARGIYIGAVNCDRQPWQLWKRPGDHNQIRRAMLTLSTLALRLFAAMETPWQLWKHLG